MRRGRKRGRDRRRKKKGKGKGNGEGEGKVEGKGKVKERELKNSWTHGHSGDFILCPMLCIALNKQLEFLQLKLVKISCIGTVPIHEILTSYKGTY